MHVFDSIGEHYSEAFAHKPGQVAATQWLAQGSGTVLDIGCGTGLPTAKLLVERGCHVVGVDTSLVMLDIARRNVPDAIFVQREMHDLAGLSPERFDAAAAFFSLLMLRRSDIGLALDAVRHVLTPHGKLALGMVEGDTDYMFRDFLGQQVPLTAYPRNELKALLSHHGFNVEELTAEEWKPDPGSPAPPQVHLYARCTVTPLM